MSGLWPENTQCVVCFTFDIDAATEFLSMDPSWASHPSLMSMCDFGPRVGVPRILDLLDRHAIKGTFFIPGYVAEQHPEMVQDIIGKGHEVAHRGYCHEQPPALSPEQQVEALEKATSALQQITGRQPAGYRAPGLDTSDYMLGLLSERGFLYDSSLMGDDIPYFVKTQQGSLVEIPVHWSLMEKSYYIFAYEAGRVGPMACVEQVYRNWTLEFEGAYRYGRSFVLVLDPAYSGYLSRLVYLERLIQHIRSLPGVTIMRAVELAQQWHERHGK